MKRWHNRVEELEEQAQPEERFDLLDWMNETYQLICREYRQSLGRVNMQTYESDCQCESERKYWQELYRVRGYESRDKPLEVIHDPPIEFVEDWLRKNDIESREATPETPTDYQERLRNWEEKQNIHSRAKPQLENRK